MQEIITRYGRLQVMDLENDLVSRFLKKYGEWSFCEAQFIAENLTDGARIADVGAAMGTFGLGLTLLRQLHSLCCVEASPALYPLLRHNVQVNKPLSVGDATTVNATVGPATADSRAADGGRQTMPTSTLHLTLEALRRGYGPFDLIKISTGGSELAILQEDQAFLRNCPGVFWLDCQETPATLDLLQVLLDNGLDVHYFAFPAAARNNFNRVGDTDFHLGYKAGLWAARGRPPLMNSQLRAKGCVLKRIGSQEELRHALWLTPRQAPAELAGHSHEEMVALAGRTLRDETFDDYLVAGAAKRPPDNAASTTAHDQIQALTEQLAAETEKSAKLAALLDAAGSERRASQIVLADERARANALTYRLEAALSERRASQIVLADERTRAQALAADLETIWFQKRAAEQALAEEKQRASNDLSILNEINAILVSQNQDLTRQAQALIEQVNGMYRSRSWRLTLPLRILGRLARGDIRGLKRLYAARSKSA
ncbi:hypothetical protein [Nitrospirillum sp. BR 11828]|uniref:hypothetical protein n=1 Tax=Nitrospirillum sp. BR 11828 TaxID=3104325 RepID=UPI002ACA316D|nr:hypothetical protein [Nitrospirillum sp. BR 11828]MDZ5650787.1 hypothetical protein [Nitrospirillum sp. BR 11828]